METQIITYLLKASLSITAFYFLYLLFFRNDTLLRVRRFYFLSVIIFSLIFPFVNIELNAEQYSIIPEFLLPAVTITATGVAAEIETVDKSSFSLSLSSIVLGITLLVSAILLIKLFIQIISLVRLERESRSVSKDNYKYIFLEDKFSSSFSFFKWIFLNPNEKGAEKDEIIAHEEEHAKQLHSVDVLLIEIVCILFWWNPFVWMLRKEMKTNLEYLADRGVVEKGYDSYVYQYTLLETINNNAGIPLINNFNVSQLKKRITMMNKEKTSIFGSVKYLLAIPLLAGLLLVNCSSNNEEKEDNRKAIIENIDLIEAFVVSADGEYYIIGKNKERISVTKAEFEELSKKRATNALDIDEMKSEPSDNKDVKPFTTVEVMPQFVGGENAMYEYISQNLKYPATAQDKGIQGRIIVRFVVAEDGSIEDVSVIRGIDPECDKEAVRVISGMPKWTPGKQNGKDVPVFFTIPIQFKLSK